MNTKHPDAFNLRFNDGAEYKSRNDPIVEPEARRFLPLISSDFSIQQNSMEFGRSLQRPGPGHNSSNNEAFLPSISESKPAIAHCLLNSPSLPRIICGADIFKSTPRVTEGSEDIPVLDPGKSPLDLHDLHDPENCVWESKRSLI